jgi:excisionase family DNA binding protein
MSEYLTVKDLCERTGFHEKTVRGLIKKHGLSHHRLSDKGKILVKTADFERFMQSNKREIKHDPFETEILRECAEAIR